MSHLFKNLFTRKPALKPILKKSQLHMEALEDRDLCAAGVWVDNHTLFIQATNKGDKVVISQYPGLDANSLADNKVKVDWTHSGKTDHLSFNQYKYVNQGDKLVLQLDINNIDFNGGSGNDTVKNLTDIKSTMRGHQGNDTLTGGTSQDMLYGGTGSDTLYGSDGDDFLYAVEPNWNGSNVATDRLFGGDGKDWLEGATGGVNFLYGEKGDDTLWGGIKKATNFLYGGDDQDEIYGGTATKGNALAVVNYILDSNGVDWAWGGDYATNFVFLADGKPVQDDDKFIQGYKSNDYWNVDPEIQYQGLFYGDHVYSKKKVGYTFDSVK
ncbi:MAG TPA: calcium-binding protein [Gemmatales bacterium]|nr:calcium-binding protein [Gemmatales bacterium]